MLYEKDGKRSNFLGLSSSPSTYYYYYLKVIPSGIESPLLLLHALPRKMQMVLLFAEISIGGKLERKRGESLD